MLNNVDANKNYTTTIRTIQLDVTTLADSSTFRWTYAYDGIEAPVKCVVLSYSSGFLKYFVDNWNLYKIGSTSINLSEKEATDDGLAKAKTFSWTVGSGNSTFEVKDFNATQAMVWETIFSNSLSADNARGHDPLTLYPMRHVWVSLDKFYLGNVYGIEVFFWADTKEVYNIQERFSTIDPPADLVAASNGNSSVDSSKVNSRSASWIAIPTLGAIALGTSVFGFGKKKNLPKSKALKIGGILLCILLSSLLLLRYQESMQLIKARWFGVQEVRVHLIQGLMVRLGVKLVMSLDIKAQLLQMFRTHLVITVTIAGPITTKGLIR